MGQLRRAVAVIVMTFSKLTMSQRLLIASVAVVLVMTLFLVQQYTGRSEYVPLLEGYGAEDQQAAIQFLQASQYEYAAAAGAAMVQPSQKREILAAMAQQTKLPSNTRLLFDSLIDKQSWTLSQRQNTQLETIAVQNELAAVIANMKGVRSAKVILNLPDRRALGQPSTEPSASATVFGTMPLDQSTVDAVAHLLASSRGIDVRRVRVIDGVTNRQHRARDEGMMAASTYLEFVAAVEDRKQHQLQSMLSAYIPGVIVTVHAQVDVTRRQRTTKNVLPDGKGSATLLTSEQTSDSQSSEGSSGGGEPGPRSNVGQDIAGLGGSGGPTMKEATGETKFAHEFGLNTETIDDPRGNPTKINAVVNIPRGYFVEAWRKRQPAAQPGAAPATEAADPSDTDLTEVLQSETTRIKREVLLQIDTSAGSDTLAGEVEVSMIPTALAGEGAGAPAEASSLMGISGGPLAMEGLAKTAGLGVLALAALGLVAVTAVKATKREPLPTAEELVGLPPALETNADLIGEAGEADSVLQGIELDDEEMKRRKMHEQVSDLVKEKPQDAAALVGKWITGIE